MPVVLVSCYYGSQIVVQTSFYKLTSVILYSKRKLGRSNNIRPQTFRSFMHHRPYLAIYLRGISSHKAIRWTVLSVLSYVVKIRDTKEGIIS